MTLDGELTLTRELKLDLRQRTNAKSPCLLSFSRRGPFLQGHRADDRLQAQHVLEGPVVLRNPGHHPLHLVLLRLAAGSGHVRRVRVPDLGHRLRVDAGAVLPAAYPHHHDHQPAPGGGVPVGTGEEAGPASGQLGPGPARAPRVVPGLSRR